MQQPQNVLTLEYLDFLRKHITQAVQLQCGQSTHTPTCNSRQTQLETVLLSVAEDVPRAICLLSRTKTPANLRFTISTKFANEGEQGSYYIPVSFDNTSTVLSQELSGTVVLQYDGCLGQQLVDWLMHLTISLKLESFFMGDVLGAITPNAELSLRQHRKSSSSRWSQLWEWTISKLPSFSPTPAQTAFQQLTTVLTASSPDLSTHIPIELIRWLNAEKISWRCFNAQNTLSQLPGSLPISPTAESMASSIAHTASTLIPTSINDITNLQGLRCLVLTKSTDSNQINCKEKDIVFWKNVRGRQIPPSEVDDMHLTQYLQTFVNTHPIGTTEEWICAGRCVEFKIVDGNVYTRTDDAPSVSPHPKIHVLHACESCSYRSTPTPLSKESEQFSFGKWLQIIMFNHTLFSSLCNDQEHTSCSKEYRQIVFTIPTDQSTKAVRLQRTKVPIFGLSGPPLQQISQSSLQLQNEAPLLPAILQDLTKETTTFFASAQLNFQQLSDRLNKLSHHTEFATRVDELAALVDTTRTTEKEVKKWILDCDELLNVNQLRKRIERVVEKVIADVEHWWSGIDSVDGSVDRGELKWSVPEYFVRIRNGCIPPFSFIPIRITEPTSVISYMLSTSLYKDALLHLAKCASSSDTEENPKVITISQPLDNEWTASLKPVSDLTNANQIHIKFTITSTTGVKLSCTSYCPREFEVLRDYLNVPYHAYAYSLSRATPWVPKGGKTNTTFFRSRDSRLIAKELRTRWTVSEKEEMIKLAPDLVEYWVNQNEISLLTKVLGVYSVEIEVPLSTRVKSPPGATSSTHNSNTVSTEPIKLDLVIMENLYAGMNNAETKFDIKGIPDRTSIKPTRNSTAEKLMSMVGMSPLMGSTSPPVTQTSPTLRTIPLDMDKLSKQLSQMDLESTTANASNRDTKTLKDADEVLKDQDWEVGGYRLKHIVWHRDRGRILRAIERDTDFLCRHQMVDYSLLVGIQNSPTVLPLTPFLPKSILDEEIKPVNSDVSMTQSMSNPHAPLRGEPAIVMGIVDVLGSYNIYKKLESKGKSTVMKNPTIVPPEMYRSRFLKAVEQLFFATGDGWDRFSEEDMGENISIPL